MKNKPNLDLYPFNKKVSLDLLCEKTFFGWKREKKSRKKISAEELKGESLNLSTWRKKFSEQEFFQQHKTEENRMSLSFSPALSRGKLFSHC